MKISLLGQLAGELPQGGYRGGRKRVDYPRNLITRRNWNHKNRHERLREVRYWVKVHLREIEEAREGGYSWGQIMQAGLKIWKEAGIFSNVYPYKDKSLLRRCYTAVKMSERKTEGVSNPRVEIQTHILIRRGII